MKKIITCTGYGTTGSSVISDLLKEFEDVLSLGDHEYRFLFDPNGVMELDIALKYLNNRQNSDYYLKNFLRFINYLSKSIMYGYYERTFNGKFKIESDKFVYDLVDISWEGYWHRDIMSEKNFKKLFYYIERFVQKKILRQKEVGAKLYKKNMMYSEVNYERFLLAVQKYVKNLIEAINAKENFIVFDQLIPPENTAKYSRYFQDIKIIIVDRDPRDIFLLEKFKYKDKFGPYMDLEKYIEWHKLIRKTQAIEVKNRNVFFVYFEDFIYDYENTIEKLLDFLEIDKKKWKYPRKYFNPELSKKNTRFWENNYEYLQFCKIIEKELPEFLYRNYR